MGPAEFDELSAYYEEEARFRSPKGVCKLGYAQPFKAISGSGRSAEGADREQVAASNKVVTDPLEVLKQEHQGILEKLDLIETQVRRRDVKGLWESTAAVQNIIVLHSIRKEEEVLFPIVYKRSPEGLTFMQIVHEDHKEFLSLLHSFRCGLQEDEILDGMVNSLIANLRNHIRKEDDEFFALIEDHLTAEDKSTIIGRMNRVGLEFVPEPAGDRSEKIKSPFLEDRKLLDAEIAHAKHESIKDDWSCH
ncbi:MAG: hemerythrin domain-containing protein [Candidatus Brocadiales bacterium]